MNLRLKTYIQLIPPTLLLGGLYLFSLLLFNRRDAYYSSCAQIEDRALIIEAFIESENPDSIESLSAYLDTNLSESKDRLLKNSTDFQIFVRESETLQILYSWTQNIDAGNKHFALIPGDHNYYQIRQLKLDAFNPPLELVFVKEHPFHVFLDRNFWVDVALILILLIVVGGLLSEILVQIIKSGLVSVDINAAKLAGFTAQKSKRKGSKIKELNELLNSINTLFDSYEAKRSENEVLLCNSFSILKPSALLQRIRKHSQTSNSITLENYNCTLWKNSTDSSHHISFLFQHNFKIFAFVGFHSSNSSGFEAGIIENIVTDTIRQSQKKEGNIVLSVQLESLRLFRKWTLLEINPGKREVREFHFGGQTSQTTIGKNSKLVIPLGFTISTPIPQMILDSEKWKILVCKLFKNHPDSAVLCIES